MTSSGKRKARASSPGRGKSSKKIHKRPDSPHHGYTAELSDVSDSNHEKDPGRTDSQNMLDEARLCDEKKATAWIGPMKADIKQQETALLQLLNAKKQELDAQDRKFKSDARELIASVLYTPSTNSNFRVEGQTRGAVTKGSVVQTNVRPRHAHFQVLVEKSKRLLELYNLASRATCNAPVADDHIRIYENDKQELALLLGMGKQVAQKMIDEVMQRAQTATPTDRTTHDMTRMHNEEELCQVEAIFASVLKRDKGTQDEAGQQQEKTRSVPDTPGIHPLLRDAERGVKRLVASLPVLDQDATSLQG